MKYSQMLRSRFMMTIVSLTLLACEGNDNTTTSERASDYLPLQKGRYISYDVTQTRYVLGVAQSTAFELKLQVVDSFTNIAGGYTYAIYRYTRNQGQNGWNYLDTWSAYTDKREAVVSEENIQFLKIKIPAVDGFEWNGNTYNTGDEDDYVMKDVNASQVFNGIHFDNCITISQSDNNDFVVFLDQRSEVYAKDIGLIYKETTQLNYCTQSELGCLGQQVIEDGLIYKQTIKDYGKE